MVILDLDALVLHEHGYAGSVVVRDVLRRSCMIAALVRCLEAEASDLARIPECFFTVDRESGTVGLICICHFVENIELEFRSEKERVGNA